MISKKSELKVKITAEAAADYYRLIGKRLPKDEIKAELEYYINSFNDLNRYINGNKTIALNYDCELVMILNLHSGESLILISIMSSAEYSECQMSDVLKELV